MRTVVVEGGAHISGSMILITVTHALPAVLSCYNQRFYVTVCWF